MPRRRRSRIRGALLARGLLHLALIRIQLRVCPARTVRSALADSAGTGVSPGAAVTDVTWAVRVLSRFLPPGSCLPRAILCQRLLRSAGLPATLHLGFTAEPGEPFPAHAWASSDGTIVAETGDDLKFAPFQGTGSPTP